MNMRPIPGFSRYMLGDDLVVYRVDGAERWRGPMAMQMRRGRVVVQLTPDSGQKLAFTRARIVCLAHHGLPSEPGLSVRHLDGQKLNDAPENLAWGTNQQNVDDCRAYTASGRYRNSRLTIEQAREIKSAPRGRGTGQALARRFGVSEATVSNIRTGRLWPWLDTSG